MLVHSSSYPVLSMRPPVASYSMPVPYPMPMMMPQTVPQMVPVMMPHMLPKTVMMPQVMPTTRLVPIIRHVVREVPVYYYRDIPRRTPPPQPVRQRPRTARTAKRVAGGWKVLDDDLDAREDIFYGRFSPSASSLTMPLTSRQQVASEQPRALQGSASAALLSARASRSSLNDSDNGRIERWRHVESGRSSQQARPLSASASHEILRSYKSLEVLRQAEQGRAYTPKLGQKGKLLAPSASTTDLASSTVTLSSSRSREDLTSPVVWPGTEFGSR